MMWYKFLPVFIALIPKLSICDIKHSCYDTWASRIPYVPECLKTRCAAGLLVLL